MADGIECNWFPSYGDLPMEIIFHIYRYLGHTDLQSAAATCTRWYEALHEAEFHKQTLVRFAKLCLSDCNSVAQCFLKSRRPYRYFCLEEITFGPVQQFMQRLGETVHEITFDNVDLGDKQFYAIMQQLPKLYRLTVTRCSPLFMSGAFLDNNDDRMIVDLTLSNIKHLSLHHNQYLSDAILLRLTALIRCIETLDLSGCHIAYHNSIHRRFYPNDATASPSESILTFKFILKVLGLHCPTLRELNFSQTMISGQAMLALCEIEDGGLHLFNLYLAGCRQLNTMGVKTFLQTQPQLVKLDLSDTNCLNDDCLDIIVNSTPLLEEVNFAACPTLTNEGVQLLSVLKYLKVLNISRCDGVSSVGLMQGICHIQNDVLRELRMSHLKVCEECIKCVAQKLPQLRVLDIGHCVNGVTDEAVQCILENLHWLRELSLEDCFRITDAALTGINLAKYTLQKQENSSLVSFQPPPSPASFMERQTNSIASMKISLRSKAEEEIVRDANRKKAMFAAYELHLIDEHEIEGYGVKRLQGLRLLNVKGCNKITDVSLKYGFKFNELKTLSLSHCQQISLLGMESLAANCIALEELDLTDCYGINDRCIQILTKKLTRLRALHISGCTQLTDHSVDAIIENCKSLQVRDKKQQQISI